MGVGDGVPPPGNGVGAGVGPAGYPGSGSDPEPLPVPPPVELVEPPDPVDPPPGDVPVDGGEAERPGDPPHSGRTATARGHNGDCLRRRGGVGRPRHDSGSGQPDRRPPGHDHRAPVPSKTVDPADERQLRNPRPEADDAPEPAHGDIEKGANHDGVELGTGALDQLLARGPDADRFAIRAHGGHDLVGIGDGDDATGERDLLAGEPARIAATIEAFVVLFHRERPRPEPRPEWPDEPSTFIGMTPDAVHLSVGKPRRFGEDFGRHHELADVVEERRPTQPRAVGGSELHLVGDEVGENAHPLGMTARLAIVDAQCGNELEHPLHVRHLSAGDAPVVCFLQLALQITRLANAPRDGEPLRRAVGEQQREIEQRRQREQAATCSLEPDDGDEHRNAHCGERKRCLAKAAWSREHAAHEGACRNAGERRHNDDGNPDEQAQQRSPPPLVIGRTCLLRGRNGDVGDVCVPRGAPIRDDLPKVARGRASGIGSRATIRWTPLIADLWRGGHPLVAAGRTRMKAWPREFWTRDVSKAHRLAAQLRAGTVWVNCYNIFGA